MNLHTGVERRGDELYREETNFFWGWLALILFFGITVLFLAMFIIQRTRGPIGSDPAPDWFYLGFAAFYFVLDVLMFNFTKLTVTADPQGITAAYGRIRHFESWDNIESVERDETSALRSYGGYGIRFGRRKGGTVSVYNLMRAPTVLLKLKQGKRAYFGFSTKRPAEVMSLVNRWKR
jgi:hypothetical protein